MAEITAQKIVTAILVFVILLAITGGISFLIPYLNVKVFKIRVDPENPDVGGLIRMNWKTSAYILLGISIFISLVVSIGILLRD